MNYIIVLIIQFFFSSVHCMILDVRDGLSFELWPHHETDKMAGDPRTTYKSAVQNILSGRLQDIPELPRQTVKIYVCSNYSGKLQTQSVVYKRRGIVQWEGGRQSERVGFAFKKKGKEQWSIFFNERERIKSPFSSWDTLLPRPCEYILYFKS